LKKATRSPLLNRLINEEKGDGARKEKWKRVKETAMFGRNG